MTEQSIERRRFQRVTFDSPCELLQGEHCWPVTLQDLSLKGALLQVPADWHGDAQHSFLIRLRLNSESVILMETTLVRHDREQLAFSCLHIDLESITHLRRLVELNSGDSQLLERELSALGQS
jgi:hypothetical protein